MRQLLYHPRAAVCALSLNAGRGMLTTAMSLVALQVSFPSTTTLDEVGTNQWQRWEIDDNGLNVTLRYYCIFVS